MRYYAGCYDSFYFAYRFGREVFDHSQPFRGDRLVDAVARLDALDKFDLESARLDPPVLGTPGCLGASCAGKHHILVSDNASRRPHDKLIRSRWCTRLPPESLCLIGNGIYVSTPEFCYLQLARLLPMTTLVRVGCFLCGKYHISETTKGIEIRKPLSSCERLGEYLDSAKGIRGVGKARQALMHVANGAESPPEIGMYLTVCLPRNLGGRGVEGSILNYSISLDPSELDIADRSDRRFFRIDMGFPEKMVGVEYLGKHHDVQTDEDRARLNTLMAKGMRILQIKYSDLTNPALTDRFASQLCALLGLPNENPTAAESYARSTLRDELFGVGGIIL